LAAIASSAVMALAGTAHASLVLDASEPYTPTALRYVIDGDGVPGTLALRTQAPLGGEDHAFSYLELDIVVTLLAAPSGGFDPSVHVVGAAQSNSFSWDTFLPPLLESFGVTLRATRQPGGELLAVPVDTELAAFTFGFLNAAAGLRFEVWAELSGWKDLPADDAASPDARLVLAGLDEIEVLAIPEPATGALLLAGLLGLAAIARRRSIAGLRGRATA
jgi:hypothetical protein